HVLWNRQGFPVVSHSIFFRVGNSEHDRVGADRTGLRFCPGLVGLAPRSGHRAPLRIENDMRFSETITMALGSLGVNKLRSGLTMFGITIGVFSVISVMTAIGALQYSIENGLSFLGSNIFQFAKYPANVSAGGNVKKKYQNRRNISFQQALHYQKLMEGSARELCLKCFGYEVKGQAVYNGIKTTPSLLIVGANRGFLTANAYTLGYGRNINDE